MSIKLVKTKDNIFGYTLEYDSPLLNLKRERAILYKSCEKLVSRLLFATRYSMIYQNLKTDVLDNLCVTSLTSCIYCLTDRKEPVTFLSMLEELRTLEQNIMILFSVQVSACKNEDELSDKICELIVKYKGLNEFFSTEQVKSMSVLFKIILPHAYQYTNLVKENVGIKSDFEQNLSQSKYIMREILSDHMRSMDTMEQRIYELEQKSTELHEMITVSKQINS